MLTVRGVCRSYHLMKAALGVRPAAEYERHMCPNPHCCRLFDKLPREKWNSAEHRDSICGSSICGSCKYGRRFLARSGPAQPSKRHAS